MIYQHLLKTLHYYCVRKTVEHIISNLYYKYTRL